MHSNLITSKCTTSTTLPSASVSEIYPYMDYIVEISNENMNVKSVIEYFLDLKVN